ncbi:MAG: biotin--[acetyl-CoA-carboxylase] ligase [Phocaeicola sp.]|uniref:biotin--[acetyl-CoA-carboxylase] ligase n=1 Tax=Phocaeicola sp. TaxID=2773926 RepID=UPI0023BC0E12|nr:biotin--[acetyl-CoA-carboxylase] ligase [Phocaeicola sp.]MDE5678640.1 biotin--[acetyl-CoA-carboxylase] ligase [Phocaeicola sp.]MDE6180374.1 biotin--[acetyl-CoA-carboxylase] ligase [Phocaeicola sp.]
MMNCADFFTLSHIPETDSTNNYLIHWSDQEDIDEFTVVQADFQTAGKGQRGNSWESEKGKNLLFSFVLYPTFLEARKQFILSQLISLAVKETLEQWTDYVSIKWPNDIYWKDKKIGGMLIENDLNGMHIGRTIAGIGLNINQSTFRSNAPNPVSLKQITGNEHDCEQILAHIMQRIKTYYQAVQKGEQDTIVRNYLHALFRREGMHRYADTEGEFTARIAGVEADGHLLLEDSNRHIRRYVFKEVYYIL